jgi:hypothetical protein
MWSLIVLTLTSGCFLAPLFNMLRDHVNVNAAYDSLERESEGVSSCKEEQKVEDRAWVWSFFVT